MTTPQPHLWNQDDTPRGGSDLTEIFETFDQLRDHIHEYLGPLNIPFSWRWHTPDQYSEPNEGDTLSISIAMAYRTTNWTCPITRDQEPQVRELLTTCAQYQQSIWDSVAEPSCQPRTPTTTNQPPAPEDTPPPSSTPTPTPSAAPTRSTAHRTAAPSHPAPPPPDHGHTP